MRLLALLLMPLMLFAALTFESNYQQEVDLLKSFDIDADFLYDRDLQAIIEEKRAHYKEKHFFRTMDDAYLFIPMIKNILSEAGVPSEFLFLAMAESNFSLKAVSNKKASGLWQFMPKTGRVYGLKIDQYVDERRDLVKSSKAAVNYLSALHKRFGKWYLAALAYNCGEGRVHRAIKRAGTDDLSILLDPKKKYVPKESRRYIRKIVALALIGSDEDFLINSEYDFLLNRANAYSIAAVKVSQGERISRVATILQMPAEEIRKLNTHLKYDFVPPYETEYEIYIPYVKLAEFKQKYTPSEARHSYIVHTVKRGDSLSRIGKKYHISYRLIKDFNRLKTNNLSLNQKLIIPVELKVLQTKDGHYMIRRGDTLQSIARAYNVSIGHLKKLNNLKSDMIRIGETLTIYD